MPIKLIAIDIDGTLLTPEKIISERVKETLLKAKEAGIKIVLSTGRPLPGATDYLTALELTNKGDYAITYNGALVQDTHSGEVLANHTLDINDFHRIEEMSRKVGVHYHTTTQDAMYTSNKDISAYTVREAMLVNMPLKFRTVEEMDESIAISKMMMIDEPAVLDEGIKQLPKEFLDRYTVLRSEPFYLEILNPSASKGQALKSLIDILGLTPDEVMAIGDNENDLDMIQFAGMGVAMGNAVPIVKENATYITDTNANDGVATVIEKFALID
ncbi:sugar-phosphatase [Desemzia incerta]|uniref:sugar-phosphatase n=1 Tax=Desemzia incerta TaxID=82801 RepID=UPI001660100E|nr:sugar-phosphatase [Desemzia incerta]